MNVKKQDKLIYPLIVVLLIVGGVAIWQFNQTSNHDKIVERKQVRFAVADAVITGPVLIAKKLGYFSDEGLDVEYVGQYRSGKEAFEVMLAGKADISTVATTPVVFNSFKREDNSIFVTYTTSYSGVKIVVRSDKGIRKPGDLKGKKIGMAKGTISQLLVDFFLGYHKILLDEVEQVPLSPSKLRDAIGKEEVDAISIWEPYASTALIQHGEKVTSLSTSKVYRIAINLAAMNDYARKNPETLQRIIRALEKSVNFINENEEEAKTILATMLEMEKRFIDHFWDEINFSLTLDQMLLNTMDNEAKWGIQHQKLPADTELPNYLDFIYHDALEAVKPEAVTIIRK